MGKVIYSMGVSLDGFIAGPRGEIAVVPDEELHRFHNEQTREVGVFLYGRRLYEVMSAWENYAEENPSAPEHEPPKTAAAAATKATTAGAGATRGRRPMPRIVPRKS